MNTYIVKSYDVRTTPETRRETTVQAATAADAVHSVLQEKHGYASQTRRWQRHTDPAVRDNAHFQCDGRGFRGASAVRSEIAERLAEVEAEHAAICKAGIGEKQTALAAAGFAVAKG